MTPIYLFLSTILLCLGVNDPGKQVNDFNAAARALGPDCWWNWGIYDERHLVDPSFVPSMWSLSDAGITYAVGLSKKYPGRTWLIYNEPEGSNGGQANTPPATAAAMFAKLYTQMKAADPTAIIACCGIIVSTQGVDWLSAFMAATTVRPDKWHVHIYGGMDPPAWDVYANYQDWWADNVGGKRGYFVSETCGMWSADQSALLRYVAGQQRPRLERMFWFGAYPEPYVPDWRCNLLRADKSRTALGDTFAQIIADRKKTPTPTATATPAATATKAPTATATKLPTATALPVATPTPTATVTPDATPIGQCLNAASLQARIAELEAQLQALTGAAQPNLYYLPVVASEE